MVPSVVPSLEVPGGQMGPRGTAGNDKSLRCSISVAVPPGPMLLPLETPCCCPSKPLVLCLETPGAVPRNPRSAAPRNPWGQILRPKFSSFGDFQAPPTKTSYTTPHYYPKYEIWAIENFLVEDPFKDQPNLSCTYGCKLLNFGTTNKLGGQERKKKIKWRPQYDGTLRQIVKRHIKRKLF